MSLIHEVRCLMPIVESDNCIGEGFGVKNVGGFEEGFKCIDQLFVSGGLVESSNHDRCVREI